mmetsp:Transcript_1074/g.2946  ORF Transcript_1074/g.2946 Transcript_1074/m.2946 type:complete len:368 (+) Transcript_1074:64-1167(+)
MLKQPVCQKRLTNVAIVRLKSHGKRFEIAAYKNKVLNWREGIEKDIDEVLQVISVFTNVSKGEVANEKDLKKVFGTTDQEEICRKILKSGELQVSDRERELQLEGLFRDIVQIVVDRCVHPQSGRQLTATAVENALKNLGFSVKSDHAAKKQALKAIECLCSEMPESFTRAKMRLRISCPDRLLEELRKHLVEEVAASIEEEVKGSTGAASGFLTFLCDPSHYRDVDGLCTVTYSDQDVSLHLVTSAVLGQVRDAQAAGGAPTGLGANAAVVASEADAQQPTRIERPPPPQPQPPPAQQEEPPKKKGLRCSSCDAEFEDATVYRQHCRSDWHNFNLKRKVKNLSPVTEEEHAEISLDQREGFLAVDA